MVLNLPPILRPPSSPNKTQSTASRALWTRPTHSRSPPSQESRSCRRRSEARWGTSHSKLSMSAISISNLHRNLKWLSLRVRLPNLSRYVIILFNRNHLTNNLFLHNVSRASNTTVLYHRTPILKCPCQKIILRNSCMARSILPQTSR